MTFSHPDADVFVPNGDDPLAALRRTTHLCVAAHQDDIEIMAYAGIADCYANDHRHFTGVVVTNGAGAPRSGAYARYSDAEMLRVRREEQRAAARLGRYNLQLQLAHASVAVKQPRSPEVLADLQQIFRECVPAVVYLHQPADKHDTHIAVFLRSLEAIRELPPDRRPASVLGCEVWRDLDWLVDADKVALDASAHPELARDLLRVFDSQISGGKRYDEATLGRRSAHATFHTSHATDKLTAITWAIDLTPLVRDVTLAPRDFVQSHIERFRADVVARLSRLGA